MQKCVALVTLHGMGETCKDYASPLTKFLQKNLEKSQFDRVHFENVFYQDILQPNQRNVFCRMKPFVDWMRLRRFLLYSFSDAVSIESGKERKNSVYDQVQLRIMEALDSAFTAFGNQLYPVIVVAQSLGCQVMSNYVWDSQKRARGCPPNFGIWRDGDTQREPNGSPKDRFRRLESLRVLFTTGCNIPIFVAGHGEIVAVNPLNKEFKWQNYYDEDDVLGWPLRPLSKSYCELVDDFEINVGGSLWGHLGRSWNPWSHKAYWSDRGFLDPLLECVSSQISLAE